MALMMEQRPQVKKCRQPVEAKKGNDLFPWRLQREYSPADTVILAQWDLFWAFDSYNYKLTNVCHNKLVSMQ